MGKVIDNATFNSLKKRAFVNQELVHAAPKLGISVSTLRRIRKAKNYTEFKELLVKDRGPQYSQRRVATSNTTTTPVKKKGFWAAIGRFFDIV